jgi:hypothetical protein
LSKNMEKRLTIRLPRTLWAALRNLITAGKVKSIQSAVIDGLEKIVKEKTKLENGGPVV